ncbi:MAG: hypothetical protein AAGF94_09000 [Pseudomonadota bacterium]
MSTARLRSAPPSIGNSLELQVIAAAVIGGTSLSGGTGTIIGALIGAVFMQSLQNGMVLLGVESSPQQMIIAGFWLARCGWMFSAGKALNKTPTGWAPCDY